MSGTTVCKRLFAGRIILLILICVFAVLSFFPCIEVYLRSGLDMNTTLEFSHYSGYLTFVSVTASAVEFFLLYRKQGLVPKVIGLVLDLLATAGALPLYRWGDMWWLSLMGGIVPQIRDYSLSPWGYAIVSVGTVIAIFYLMLMIVPSWRKKSNSAR